MAHLIDCFRESGPIVQALDFGDPRARTPMRQLGQIGERRGAEIEYLRNEYRPQPLDDGAARQ